MLSITNCRQAKSIDKKTSERHVLHLSITDIGCSRMKMATSLSVPMTNVENSIVQAIKDMRDRKTLTWDSVIMIHDASISNEILTDITAILSEDAASVASFDLANDEASISDIFSNLPARELGNKFLVIAKEDFVPKIHKKAEETGLMNLKTQWFYLVTDTNHKSEMMPSEIQTAKDGYNLAFMFNSSTPDDTGCQVVAFKIYAH